MAPRPAANPGRHVAGQAKRRECCVFHPLGEDCQTVGLLPAATDVDIAQNIALFAGGDAGTAPDRRHLPRARPPAPAGGSRERQRPARGQAYREASRRFGTPSPACAQPASRPVRKVGSCRTSTSAVPLSLAASEPARMVAKTTCSGQALMPGARQASNRRGSSTGL